MLTRNGEVLATACAARTGSQGFTDSPGSGPSLCRISQMRNGARRLLTAWLDAAILAVEYQRTPASQRIENRRRDIGFLG